jgi:hypothetical protein
MYSQQLQDYIFEAISLAGVQAERVKLLDNSMACYLQALSNVINAQIDPPADLLTTTINLLSISMALADFDIDLETNGSHYLVGMGLEQSGELLSRHHLKDVSRLSSPSDNDYWYRLLLALLHYMAGGFRVQALSTLRRLEKIAESSRKGNYSAEYEQAMYAVQRLFSGRGVSAPVSTWENYLFGRDEPQTFPGRRIYRLSEKIRYRRRVALSDLGQGGEVDWLIGRGITDQGAADFWHRYLGNLEQRGIISFTNEQIGPGFDYWLRPNDDLLVLLPTGSGKSIIGELRAALTLTMNKQVIWIMPTRSLVRQAQRELRRAFRPLGVTVEELPTTEDFKPLYTDRLIETRLVAATTPEKLAALIRTNPEAVSNVGLIILDEAQILFDLNRGTTAEYALVEIQQRLPQCKFVLMSAVLEYSNRLRNFIQRLREEETIRELVSEFRPTRRICGVITNTVIEDVNTPVIEIYPPGPQREDGETDQPYRLTLAKQRLIAKAGPTAIAQSFLKSIAPTSLRSVTFVNRIDSSETQAKEVARRLDERIQLPGGDLSRLRVELGRESVVETSGTKRIAPHHAGLTPLEQHLVEKWLRQRIINSVVATPTLAQGVNLPFDISVLTFLRRRNLATKQMEPLSQSEIMNMLGRAGRAGQVSDGICLISMRSIKVPPTRTLDSARRYYFRIAEPTGEFLGLSRLLAIASNSDVSNPEWTFELGDMNFSGAQTLVSFSLNAIRDSDDFRGSLSERLRLFPSIQDLEELWGQEWDVLDALNSHTEPMVQNIFEECKGDSSLLESVTRTGMPLEYLRSCLLAIREDYHLLNRTMEQQIGWADGVVRASLEGCRERQWYKNLFGDLTLESIFPALERWRSGRPMIEIEQNWQYKSTEKQNRIQLGKFFNHKVSLLAQFWGALAICEELVFPDEEERTLGFMQTFVREGVSSIIELEWLNRIGGIDRVLAHSLSKFTPENLDIPDQLRYIRREINRWRNNRNAIPIELIDDELGALVSILDEM